MVERWLCAWMLLTSACALDRTGLAVATDGGVAVDTGQADGSVVDPDANGDGGLPPPPEDAGCHDFETPRPLWTLHGRTAGQGFLDPAAVGVETDLDDAGQIVLALQPYRHGGVLLRGYEVALNPADGLASLDPEVVTGRALSGDLARDWGGGTPDELAISTNDRFSVRGDGEIFLEAGAWSFELDVDDVGLLELDVGGVTHAVQRSSPGAETMSVRVPTDAWYAIRLGHADSGGDADFRVRAARDGDGLQTVRADRLRTRFDALEGRELFGFDAILPGPSVAGSRIDPSDTSHDFGGGAPSGVGITGGDTWSARWVGRYWLADGGGTVRAQSDGPHRLFVDGVFLGGIYDSGVYDTTYELHVPVGFVDVTVELDENTGAAFMHLERDGAPFAASDLRPLSRYGATPWTVGAELALDIPAGGSATGSVTMAPPSEPSVVELSAVITTVEPDAVTISVATPAGTSGSARLPDLGAPAGGDRWHFRWTFTGAAIPADPRGPWSVTVDHGGASAARLETVGVLAHLGGEPTPYPEMGVFTSGLVDLGGRARITAVIATGWERFGTTITALARAGDDGASATGFRFTPAGEPGGALATELVGRVVQVAAELRGPGQDTPRVQELVIVGGECRGE
jgi:hypothetical protein